MHRPGRKGPRRRRVAPAGPAAVLLALALLTGCGSGGDDGGSASPAASAGATGGEGAGNGDGAEDGSGSAGAEQDGGSDDADAAEGTGDTDGGGATDGEDTTGATDGEDSDGGDTDDGENASGGSEQAIEYSEDEEEYLEDKVPDGADPAALLEVGEEACQRIGYLDRHDRAGAVEALRDGEIPQAEDAIEHLCPEYRPLLKEAQQ